MSVSSEGLGVGGWVCHQYLLYPSHPVASKICNPKIYPNPPPKQIPGLTALLLDLALTTAESGTEAREQFPSVTSIHLWCRTCKEWMSCAHLKQRTSWLA